MGLPTKVKIIDPTSNTSFGFACPEYVIDNFALPFGDQKVITMHIPDFEETVKITQNNRDTLNKLPESITSFCDYLFDHMGRRAAVTPEKVIFNNPATIVIWKDGTKTVVKKQKGDRYDKEKGLALCYMKKMLGNTSRALNDALEAAYETD